MAEITLMHQEIIMLKLRITALESQRNELESDLSVALAERDQADKANQVLTEKLKNTERVCSALEVEILRERRTSNAAMQKIEQLENQLLETFSDDSD
jgi:predicted  nucleic acid-binding Zn-ribbon protein